MLVRLRGLPRRGLAILEALESAKRFIGTDDSKGWLFMTGAVCETEVRMGFDVPVIAGVAARRYEHPLGYLSQTIVRTSAPAESHAGI